MKARLLPTKPRRWNIADSILSWSKAVRITLKSRARKIWHWPSFTSPEPSIRRIHNANWTRFDVHAFGGEGPIIIGGVRIPYEKGLLAHSDGDVALHALTDALLGAAALGDIGKLFPDTDPAFKGADSRELLREAWRRIQAKGYTLGNVDVTIIAQAPKMLPHIPQMRVFIAEDLGCHMDDVNVKATTTENWDLPDVGKGLPVKRWRYSLRQQND